MKRMRGDILLLLRGTTVKTTKVFSRFIAALLFISVVGCAGSSSSDNSNKETDGPTEPFEDLLSIGVGHYTGDCTSASTGMTVAGGSIDLTDYGFLQGQEFTSTIGKDTHLISLTQTRSAD